MNTIPCKDCLILPMCRMVAKKYSSHSMGIAVLRNKCSIIDIYIHNMYKVMYQTINPEYQVFKYIQTGFLYSKWLGVLNKDEIDAV